MWGSALLNRMLFIIPSPSAARWHYYTANPESLGQKRGVGSCCKALYSRDGRSTGRRVGRAGCASHTTLYVTFPYLLGFLICK